MLSALGIFLGFSCINRYKNNVIKKNKDKACKLENYYKLLLSWLDLKNNNVSIEEYFISNNYTNIAIYGMGELGKKLYEELKDSKKINIKYGIDENNQTMYSDLNIYSLYSNKLPEVDVIIVTPIFEFFELEAMMQDIVDYPIVSLEEVIYELEYK